MDKNMGFNRNIFRSWLDATAALCVERDDPEFIRNQLDALVIEQITSTENRRKSLDILLNIWVKTGYAHPDLRNEARMLFAQSDQAADRVWLHYGLTLLYYPFFRLTTAMIGQLSRYQDTFTPQEIKKRIIAEMGQLGGLDKATERVIFSLRNWGILIDGSRRYTYRPAINSLVTDRPQLEQWLLATALTAHPALELPFTDLVRLPELFPFRLTLNVDALRREPRFEVHRQGLGWDMVGLAN